jgi:hypothetical protein
MSVGFKVFGFRVSDFGFRVHVCFQICDGFEFRVSGFGFRVSGWGSLGLRDALDAS